MNKAKIINKLTEFANGCEKNAGEHAVRALEVRSDERVCELERYQALLLKGRANGVRDAIVDIRMESKTDVQ